MNEALHKNYKAAFGALLCVIYFTLPGYSVTAAGSIVHRIKNEEHSNGGYEIAKERIITGTVKGDDGQTLPGASVLVKGTTLGTTTDSDGRFTLSAPDNVETLVISYIGYTSQEIAIGNQTVINITLIADMQILSEVVVVGYGSQKKSDLTGSIVSIKGDDVMQLPTQRVDQALQGRAAGVMVLSPSGVPGGPTTIRIRGMNSINGGNAPLVVIDGLQGGDLNSLNPNDVESMEILKDASATAIYGSQGANGVILITTKKGKKGAPMINYTYTVGAQQLRSKLDVMNAGDFARTANAFKATQNQPGNVVIVPTPIFTDAEVAAFDKNGGTDWQNEIYQTAPIQNHQLSLSGGFDKVQYLVSGGYLDQKGILLNSSFKRFSLRTNVNVDINKWSSFGLSWAGIKEQGNAPPFFDGAGNADALGYTVSVAPRWAATIPVFDEFGNYNRHPSNYGEPGMWNPLASALEPLSDNGTLRNNVNAFIQFKFLKDFTFRVTGGAVTANQDNYRYLNRETKEGFQRGGQGSIISSQFARYQNSNILTYDKQFSVHHLTITAVSEQQVVLSKGSSVVGSGFLVDGAGIYDLGGATSLVASSYNNDKAINSFLGRVNYSFKDKYLLTASYRADGASVFGENNKWGYFPSVSGAWKVSEESFIKDLGWFSDLKIRGSWGITGNQAISPYETLASLSSSNNNYPYQGNSLSDVGYGINRAANPNLKWESTKQTDIGFDIGLFNGRLTATFDYYEKTTENLLLSRQLPTYTGFNSIIDNVGSVGNKGIELTIGGDPLVGDFKWNTSFNISGNKSKVLDLGGLTSLPFRTTPGAGYGFSTRNNNALLYLKPGSPFGEMTGWITDGTWGEAESDKAALFGQLPGDIKYRDINNDGKINRSDLTVIGQAQPKFMFGWNNRFSYKNFDLMFLIQGVQGNDLFNVNRIRLERPGDSEGTSNAMLDRWTIENQDTDVPAFTSQSDRKAAALTSTVSGIDTRVSRWVEDASYIRLNNITLAYSIPQSIISKIGLNKLRAYVTGSNVFTITKYTGYDPEVSSFNTNDARLGLDFGSYPTARSVVFGIDLTF